MDKKEKEKPEEQKPKVQTPFCTTAPSAEHARAWDEDEPCTDFIVGDTDED